MQTITQDEYNELEPWLDDTNDDEQLDDDTPEEGDYFITDERGWTIVTQYDNLLARFRSYDNAVIQFIRGDMQHAQFFANGVVDQQQYDAALASITSRPDES